MVVDTNCDPDVIHPRIPGNDDAIRSVHRSAPLIADAVTEGRFIAQNRPAPGCQGSCALLRRRPPRGSYGTGRRGLSLLHRPPRLPLRLRNIRRQLPKGRPAEVPVSTKPPRPPPRFPARAAEAATSAPPAATETEEA